LLCEREVQFLIAQKNIQKLSFGRVFSESIITPEGGLTDLNLVMSEKLLKFINPEILNSKTITNGNKYNEKRNQSRRAQRKLRKTHNQRTKSPLDASTLFAEALGGLTKLSLHFTQFQIDVLVEKEANKGFPSLKISSVTKKVTPTLSLEATDGLTDRIRHVQRDGSAKREAEDDFFGDSVRKIPKLTKNFDG
jgi:hypothetical protein